MTQSRIDKLKLLKDKFKALGRTQREAIGVCFLKLKLGVHSPEEFEKVMHFLDGFEFEINTANLDAIMNYLHSESHTLPEFMALEESLTDIREKLSSNAMPSYNADEAVTLKEGVKPFKD